MLKHSICITLLMSSFQLIAMHQSAQQNALAASLKHNEHADDTDLHSYARCGDTQKLQSKLQEGISANVLNAHCETPLHSAQTQEVAQLLLNNEADINAVDKHGWTPLHTAVFLNRIAVVTLLLNHNAKVDVQAADGAGTPLHIAAAGGYQECIDLLLAAGSNPWSKDEEGNTAYGVAISFNTIDKADALLKAMEPQLPHASVEQQRTMCLIFNSYSWDYANMKQVALKENDVEFSLWCKNLPEDQVRKQAE